MIPIETTRGTIFIAEDNPILLQGLGRALEAHGYRVVTAPDGREILALLSGADAVPDLILLDVMMPNLSGLDVLRAVREDERLGRVPTMLVSAAPDESFAVDALREGADDVMTKPFRLGELIARVEGHVRRHREVTDLREELRLHRERELRAPHVAALG